MPNTTSNCHLTQPAASLKPQGWERAKMAKQGYYQCYYDCDKYFKDQNQARNHHDCPNRLKLENDLSKMDALLRTSDSNVIRSPIKEWSQKDVARFEKYLKKLQTESLSERVERFLKSYP